MANHLVKECFKTLTKSRNSPWLAILLLLVTQMATIPQYNVMDLQDTAGVLTLMVMNVRLLVLEEDPTAI